MSKNYIDDCDCALCLEAKEFEEMKRKREERIGINPKFSYCGYAEGTSDKEFLGWIYARLNDVFGESQTLSYMKRLENIIDGMEQSKMINSEMTREEAIKLMCQEFGIGIDKRFAEQWVSTWEKLGIVKFKNEAKPVIELILVRDEAITKRKPEGYGTIRIEEWPEGLVLWVGGEIVYKSWEDVSKNIKLQKRREEFRQYLADAGMPEHTLYSSPILKAFDDAFGLRK